MTVGVVLALVAPAGCGVVGGDDAQLALDMAKASARWQASNAAESVQATLRDPGVPHGPALLDAVSSVAESVPHGRGTVFGRVLVPGGSVEVDVAFAARGEIRMERVFVRLCVRLAGTPGREAKVSMTDTPCGTSLGDYDDFVGGQIDLEITLED